MLRSWELCIVRLRPVWLEERAHYNWRVLQGKRQSLHVQTVREATVLQHKLLLETVLEHRVYRRAANLAWWQGLQRFAEEHVNTANLNGIQSRVSDPLRLAAMSGVQTAHGCILEQAMST